MSGVTAAVVGVILNLALVFGAAVVFHDQTMDYFALFLTIVSLVVLLRFKIDVMWIVLGGGFLGLIFEILNKIEFSPINIGSLKFSDI